MLRHRIRTFLMVVAVAAAVAARTAPVHVQSVTPAATDPSNAFFDDTQLQEVRLSINPKDWQALKDHYLDNTYYTCDFQWRDQILRNISIRSRGTGSRSGIRPGLRVDFDRNVTDQTFLGLKSFVLRNNTQDPSSMHERISMLLFRRMGLPASRETHTRLYINNEYAGLYLIVESIDKSFLKRTYGDDSGYLYKYDFNPGDTGYYFEDRGGSDPKLYVPHPFKPETHELEAPPRAIGDLIDIVNHDSDAIFQTTIAPYLDLDRFIRHIAMENVLGDDDGFDGNWSTNNFYFYLASDQKKFTFIAWDKSNSFIEGPEYGILHNITDQQPDRVNRLTKRVLGIEELKNKYLDRLLEYADALVDGTPVPTAFPPVTVPASDESGNWMEREIIREYDQIRDAFYADPNQTFTTDQFEDEVQRLRFYSFLRPASIRRQVAELRSKN